MIDTALAQHWHTMTPNEPLLITILGILGALLLSAFGIGIYLCMYHTNTPKVYAPPKKMKQNPIPIPVPNRTHSQSKIVIQIPESSMSYVSINPMFHPQPAAK
jgi:hypothetical protein